jgi:4-hydroxy-tetrahydrodipicolinate reductase
MDEMKLVVTGAAGRMGLELIRAIHSTSGAVLAGAIERSGADAIGKDAGLLAGLDANGVIVTDDPLPVFAAAQGVLDFTAPQASVEFAALAAQARIVHVVGTTGMQAAHEEKVRAAARHAIIVKSGNFSLGVNVAAILVEQAARMLGPEYDIEIVEMHHRHKVDAPSGTALLLGEAAADGRGIALAQSAVRARDGHTGARVEGTIGFASLRGGSVVGDHTVMLAGPGERIEITHIAQDRSIFARGAVRAALWGHGKKPGLYSMRDVLGLG